MLKPCYSGLMIFYCLVWLWRQLIEISVLRTWKMFCQNLGDFLCSLMIPPLSFKTIRSLWKVCFFLDEIYGLIVFQNSFWSECLSLQILEKWSLTLFLFILTAMFLSWRYFSQSSGLLDLLNCVLHRLRNWRCYVRFNLGLDKAKTGHNLLTKLKCTHQMLN